MPLGLAQGVQAWSSAIRCPFVVLPMVAQLG